MLGGIDFVFRPMWFEKESASFGDLESIHLLSISPFASSTPVQRLSCSQSP